MISKIDDNQYNKLKQLFTIIHLYERNTNHHPELNDMIISLAKEKVDQMIIEWFEGTPQSSETLMQIIDDNESEELMRNKEKLLSSKANGGNGNGSFKNQVKSSSTFELYKYQILSIISDEHNVDIDYIHKELELDKSTIRQVIGRLKKRGLIKAEPHPMDMRKNYYRLARSDEIKNMRKDDLELLEKMQKDQYN
ncbi:MAG: winged helix-turn-helix transcriptional regulator [Candidatus Heimdallarchaeota archaeon]|nr:winged helix-turn-helix transcriptional regulator [Candidatus Heimdallarchaeota archaeon]